MQCNALCNSKYKYIKFIHARLNIHVKIILFINYEKLKIKIELNESIITKINGIIFLNSTPHVY
jgi:hypothetical protein